MAEILSHVKVSVGGGVVGDRHRGFRSRSHGQISAIRSFLPMKSGCRSGVSKLVIDRRVNKIRSSKSFGPKMSLTIGKAQKWWEKGLQSNMKEINSAQDLVDSLQNAGDNEKLNSEKRNEDSVSYHTPRFRAAEFVSSSLGVVSDGKGDLLNSMADSYRTTVWDNQSVNQIGLAGGWQEQNSGIIPHLSQLPADSAFIERAARFSYFNSGNIVDLMNTFPMNQPVSPYHQLTSMPCGPIDTNPNPPSTSKDDRRRSPQTKNARRDSETKQSESDETESVGGRGEEETSLIDTSTEPSLPKGYGPKKRRRAAQDTELEQSQQLSGEDANGNSKNSSPVKISGKNAKSSSQADPSKEEYIHIRARRGQATNSHSLAERIRREKISERMKFLQDLVPGCSKVTGKAVMLDEIINYVQSLQRQVEFLSMKLATVDPRVDFNIDSLLAKEQLFPTLAGVSSSMGFSSDMQMTYPPMHPSHPIGIHPPVIGNTSDALRNLNSQLTGINEATQQMPNVWDYELQNVVQMGFDPNAPIDNQETNNSKPYPTKN